MPIRRQRDSGTMNGKCVPGNGDFDTSYKQILILYLDSIIES